jgi:uncharacterized protein with FMN-binding domain
MKRAALAIAGTVAALVLLLSFKTHTQAAPTSPPAASAPSASGGGSGSSGSAGSSTTSGSSRKGSSSSSSSAAKTYTGDAADTRYGPVQVRITVRNGKVTKVEAVEYPTQDPRDAQINSYAIPALDQEALAAGNAHIDMVSGATYTSEGYLSSLQSALDKAGL